MTFLIVLLIGFAIASYGAVRGSLSSIRPEWHVAEEVYSRCIRPYVETVIGLPSFAGCIMGTAMFFLLSRLVSLDDINSGTVSVVPCLLISFFWARQRGKRIYTANVRRVAPHLAP